MIKVFKKRFPLIKCEKNTNDLKTEFKQEFDDKNHCINTIESIDRKRSSFESNIEENNLNVKKIRSDFIIDVPKGRHTKIEFKISGSGQRTAIVHVCKATINQKNGKIKAIKQIASTTIQ
jgi:hypothetical protein